MDRRPPSASGSPAPDAPLDVARDGALQGARILLVVCGGIAAYKCLELIRRLRERGAAVRCILTEAGSRFVTPLALAALSENRVHQDLWALGDDNGMEHIRLTREADLVVVAPATADMLARMAAGRADDLATATLLASNKPVLVAPAMNVYMWNHPATVANIALLESRGVHRIGPEDGDLACGEIGGGRLAEPMAIIAAIATLLGAALLGGPKPLAGRRALVTSGPTHEPIDPVRYIANRSSGRQGHAIAAALAGAGAAVTLVSGPVAEADPPGVTVVRVETARQMLEASLAALPADIAVCAAAVADWRPAAEGAQKLKKTGGAAPTLALAENPDILATLSAAGEHRPALVVGFAAETENLIDHAAAKLARKGCDWILANDVSAASGTFGGARNRVHLLARDPAGGKPAVESWPELDKTEVARRLAGHIAAHFAAGEKP